MSFLDHATIEVCAKLAQRWGDDAAEFSGSDSCRIQTNLCRNLAIAIRNLASTDSAPAKSAAETWAHIERLLHDECGLPMDQGLTHQRPNCINAIKNGLPNEALMAAAIEFLSTGESLHKIRVNGKMMDRRAVAAALSHPSQDQS